MPRAKTETHLVSRVGWLRAGVLGANDGILSTTRLIVGVASASGDKSAVMVAGLAGLVSAATFASGAALPLLVAATVTEARVLMGVTLATLLALVALGAIGAGIGGAGIMRGAARVTIWGALAMLATAVVGWAFGTVV